MVRSVLEMVAEAAQDGAAGESMLGMLRYAVLSIAKVFVVCFMGFLMASKRVGVLNPSGRKLLNGLVFSLLLPCLIFAQLGRAITIEKILEWWFIPVGAIIVYTYVFKMLAPPPGETFDSCYDEKEKLPIKAPNATPCVAKYPSSAHGVTYEEEPLLSTEEEEHDVPYLGSKIMIPIKCTVRFLQKKQLLQPPIIASVLAITLGVVPFLKNLILTDDTPLFFLTDGCLILGEAMIPCILLAVGGNLVDGPGEGSRRLGVRTTVAIIFARLVLVPIAGVGIVSFADKLGFIPKGDKMFKFVLLLQHSMPTSVLSGAVANLRGCGKESAAMLFRA
ncbi:hypothetical protein E2562_016615 [Oryza meyeriana var. granulata]|uniref:Auxin efflux carrier component n=1 Tax=Oryza meyeriana var. granulata TaxID=110450 RepID=A0A6G1EKS9_9ORYZ|nr:hypothetical protein E2562_016615 [Oryza meyeriana var. granulata]